MIQPIVQTIDYRPLPVLSDDKQAILSTKGLIYIIGQKQFQHELLTLLLEKETKARCRSVQDLEEIKAIEEEYRNLHEVILLDCLGKTSEQILAGLTSDRQEMMSQCFFCLFNVPCDRGIEIAVIEKGVRGVFYEQDGLEHFVKGIKKVFLGEFWFTRKIMTQFILGRTTKKQGAALNHDPVLLTPREIETLRFIAVGETNTEIAEKLFISPNTVRTHVYNAFKKINVTNRLQAALWVSENL